MIEGKSLAKTAALCWRSSGRRRSALATSVSARAGCQQAAKLKPGSSRRTRPSSSNPSRADGSDLPRGPRKRGGKARHPGPYRGQYSSSRRPRPEGCDLRRGVCQESCVRGRFSHHALHESVVEDDGELGFGLAHHSRGGIFHVCATLAQDEIQQFDCSLIGWKMASRLARRAAVWRSRI